MYVCIHTALEEVTQVQHGAEEVQSREQEGLGAVCEFLRTEGDTDVTQRPAGQRLPVHH